MKIIICGCNGKMGKAVSKSAKKMSECEIVAGVDINASSEENLPIFQKISDVNIKADVIIDFSHPSLVSSLLEYCKKSSTPAVICTTGFSKEQLSEIEKASKHIPIFYSRNMSLGINLILELSKLATKVLSSDFDIEIIEKHHNQKIDAPSGTALMIAEEISKLMDAKTYYNYNRSNSRNPRSKNEIGIHSVRGGTIPGDHEVIFAGKDEIITIAHHAGSRDIFACGSLKAAKFVINQKPGLYTMQSMVKNII